jgi:hypothetical protein
MGNNHSSTNIEKNQGSGATGKEEQGSKPVDKTTKPPGSEISEPSDELNPQGKGGGELEKKDNEETKNEEAAGTETVATGNAAMLTYQPSPKGWIERYWLPLLIVIVVLIVVLAR